jgi:hypothetical protein
VGVLKHLLVIVSIPAQAIVQRPVEVTIDSTSMSLA